LGIVLLAIAPVLFLTRRVERNLCVALCIVFVAVFLFLWSTVLSVLRYMIPGLVLLVLFGAARLVALIESGKQPVRAAALGVLGYVFVFALPVTVILEVYTAEPAFLARAMSEEAALEKALPPFRVMHDLKDFAGPDDNVLSIGNWAICYAPFPARVRELLLPRAYTPEDLEDLNSGRFRFVILPDSPNGAELRNALTKWSPRQLASANGFQLFEVGVR
jgi:hypothetical protein